MRTGKTSRPLPSGAARQGWTRGLGRWVALAVALALGSPAWAQTGNATLRGKVTDPQKAAMTGVTVTLQREKTADIRNTTTDASGNYSFAAVLPGIYTLKIEAQGFRTHEEKVTLNPSDVKGVDVHLEIGAMSEEIQVSGESEILQTETGARESVVTGKQLQNLSVIGRDAVELLKIMPGTVTPDNTAGAGFEVNGILGGGGATGSGAVSINGMRGENLTVTLDGTRLADIGANSGQLINPNTEFVDVVKIQSSNYAAEFGSAAANITAVTKSGSNEFHGTVYGYSRTHGLQANDRSNNLAGLPKPLSKFFYPGANLGGPLVKDKLFFFAGLEIQRQSLDTGSRLSVVPTDAMRQGDFSELLANRGANLAQPVTVNIPGTNTPAPNNDLRPYVDPLGQGLINLYPKANYTDPNNRYNYVFSQLRDANRGEGTVRLDYNISPNAKAYLRVAYNTERDVQPRGLWWDSSDYELPTPIIGDNKGKSATLGLVNILSPTMTNEVLITGGRLTLDNAYQDPSKITLDTNGLSGLVGLYPGQSNYVPSIAPFGAQGIDNLWSPMSNPLYAHSDTYQISDNLTKIFDTHAIKVGVSLEQLRKEQNFQNDNSGRLAFAPWGQANTTGSVLGDTITGLPVQVIWGTQFPVIHMKAYNIEGFLQDSWKVKPNVTLEYGVRLGYLTNNAEQEGLGGIFSPSAYDPTQGPFVNGDITHLNGLLYASKGQVPKGGTDNRPLSFMPRLNFAWDTNGQGKTIVRGGAGLFVNRPQGNAEYDTLRFAPNAYAATVDAFGAPNLTLENISTFDPNARLGGQNVVSANINSVDWPTTLTTSLSVAQRLGHGHVLEVGYVGTFAHHLYTRRNSNVIPEGALLSGTVGNSDLSIPVDRVALDANVVNTFRAYPALGGVELREYTSNSHYNSMQVTLSRQSGKSFQYMLAYTYSLAKGEKSTDEQHVLVDPLDPRTYSYGVLPTDRTHVATLSYNWNIKDLTSKGGFLKGLLNGWQISGVSTATAGAPIYLSFTGDIAQAAVARAWSGTDAHLLTGNAAASFGTAAPVFNGNPWVGGSNVGDKVLDLNAIGIPAFGALGDINNPPYIRSPFRMFHDITLIKNFTMAGEKKLQLRLGAFNVFNMAYATPGDINTTLSTVCNVKVNHVPNGAGGFVDNVCDPTQGFSFDANTIRDFGKITTKRGHRIIELAAKFFF